MHSPESIKQRIGELKARAELLAGQVAALTGKRLREAEQELHALELMIRQYEGRLAALPARRSASPADIS